MTSYVVWLGDGGTDKKTGEGAGGGRVKDAAIFFGSDVDGQDQKHIRGTAQVGQFVDKVREVGPIWFGHVQRRDAGYVGRRVRRMERPGRRRRGRPKGRVMDVVMEDM